MRLRLPTLPHVVFTVGLLLVSHASARANSCSKLHATAAIITGYINSLKATGNCSYIEKIVHESQLWDAIASSNPCGNQGVVFGRTPSETRAHWSRYCRSGAHEARRTPEAKRASQASQTKAERTNRRARGERTIAEARPHQLTSLEPRSTVRQQDAFRPQSAEAVACGEAPGTTCGGGSGPVVQPPPQPTSSRPSYFLPHIYAHPAAATATSSGTPSIPLWMEALSTALVGSSANAETIEGNVPQQGSAGTSSSNMLRVKPEDTVTLDELKSIVRSRICSIDMPKISNISYKEHCGNDYMSTMSAGTIVQCQIETDHINNTVIKDYKEFYELCTRKPNK